MRDIHINEAVSVNGGAFSSVFGGGLVGAVIGGAIGVYLASEEILSISLSEDSNLQMSMDIGYVTVQLLASLNKTLI